MIGIINYGIGNLRSVKNSLDFLGLKSKLISKSAELAKCDRIILPGVGAFGAAMDKLSGLGFDSAIRKFAVSGKPVLGICLGMQLLFDTSKELGVHKGLGLLSGSVEPFSKKVTKLPLPLIGWTGIKKAQDSEFLGEIKDDATFYFVHSFYCRPANKKMILANSKYGINFPSIIGHKNIYGCQFHPEKSQTNGLLLLKNFSTI